MFNILIDFLFPQVCGFCGKINKNSICSKCYREIKPLILAHTIQFDDKKFSNLIYIFKYEGIIRNKILDYKFNDKSYLYKTFAKIILKNKKICGILKKYDIIIPVPMRRKKMLKRGYNQTELIAKELAENIGFEYNNKALIKVKDNSKQSLLNLEQREKNVVGAYEVNFDNNYKVQNKNVLLIDDIYTTGSTANECSFALKQAGAKNVDVLVIAKD